MCPPLSQLNTAPSQAPPAQQGCSPRCRGGVDDWRAWSHFLVSDASRQLEPRGQLSSELWHTMRAFLTPQGSQLCSKLWENHNQTPCFRFLLPAQPHHQTISFLANDLDISEFSRYSKTILQPATPPLSVTPHLDCSPSSYPPFVCWCAPLDLQIALIT